MSAALTTLGDELARTHGATLLIGALLTRLHADGREDLANYLRMSAGREPDGPSVRDEYLAPALVARLRIDGRGQLADALASLLGSAYIDCDPRFSLEEDDDSLAHRREWIAQIRAEGGDPRANLIQTGECIRLKGALTERLCADGRRKLADAIQAAFKGEWEASERRASGEEEKPDRFFVTADKRAPPEDAGQLEPEEELARLHDADLLARALVVKLRAEGREVLAGSIMGYWLRDVAGPVVEPRPLAAALVARLQAEDRDEVADEIDILVSDTSIDRELGDIMAAWQNEVAGPVLDAGALGAALVAAIRKQRRDVVADAVMALLDEKISGPAAAPK